MLRCHDRKNPITILMNRIREILKDAFNLENPQKSSTFWLVDFYSSKTSQFQKCNFWLQCTVFLVILQVKSVIYHRIRWRIDFIFRPISHFWFRFFQLILFPLQIFIKINKFFPLQSVKFLVIANYKSFTCTQLKLFLHSLMKPLGSNSSFPQLALVFYFSNIKIFNTKILWNDRFFSLSSSQLFPIEIMSILKVLNFELGL